MQSRGGTTFQRRDNISRGGMAIKERNSDKEGNREGRCILTKGGQEWAIPRGGIYWTKIHIQVRGGI